jgi:hypothetical protein
MPISDLVEKKLAQLAWREKVETGINAQIIRSEIVDLIREQLPAPEAIEHEEPFKLVSKSRPQHALRPSNRIRPVSRNRKFVRLFSLACWEKAQAMLTEGAGPSQVADFIQQSNGEYTDISKPSLETTLSEWKRENLDPLETALGSVEAGGERISPATMKDCFNITQQQVRRRMREGMSPAAGLLTLPDVYKQLSHEDKLLLGWSYWCSKETVPETDEDLLYGIWSKTPFPALVDRVELMKWDRDGWPENGRRYQRGGQEEFAWYLAEGCRSPKGTMLSWMSALAAHLGIGMGPEGRPVVSGDYSFDTRATYFMPDCFETVESLVVKALRTKGPETARPHTADFNFDSYLDLIGVVVYVRKLMRPLFVLADLRWAHYQWWKAGPVPSPEGMKRIVDWYKLEVPRVD